MELCHLGRTASVVAAEGTDRDGGLLPALNRLSQVVIHVTSAQSLELVTWPHLPTRRAGNVRDEHGIFDETSLDMDSGCTNVTLDSHRLTVSDTDILAPFLQGLTN